MFIDLLVTTYKRAEDLMVLMKNLEDQTYLNFRLQVFDGTPDETVKVAVDNYLSGQRHLEYKLIFHSTACGMTRQRNIAAQNTEGDISIFLDDDVELRPNYLSEVVKVFENDVEKKIAGLNGFDMFNLPGDNIRKLGKRKRIYRAIGLLPDVGPARYLPWGHPTAHFNFLKSGFEDVDLLIGHNMAFRTDLLKKFHFAEFFEQFQTYVLYDDSDICLRMKKAGYRLVLCYDAKLIHKISPSGRPAAEHYGFQAFYNAHRNWKLFGSQKPIHKLKFWLWELFDIMFQLPSHKTRQMSIGRLKIYMKTFLNNK